MTYDRYIEEMERFNQEPVPEEEFNKTYNIKLEEK